jgi:hypothetical protein
MGALSRVLYDEFRKSTELTYNIARIFLAFSNFVEVRGYHTRPACWVCAMQGAREHPGPDMTRCMC